jgi:sulfopyruvate decarboxylase TPP-binding subunit
VEIGYLPRRFEAISGRENSDFELLNLEPGTNLGGDPMADYPLSAKSIMDQFKRAGIRFVVALPDRVTSHYLLKGILADRDFHVVQVCKEDEGVSICSGLYAAGHKSVFMMQYTGFLDSINAIRGVAVEGHFPVCMVVGLLGKEPDVPPTQSKKYGVKIIEPILDVMGIEHHLIERDSDAGQIGAIVEKAFASSSPSAILIGREPR